MESKNLIFKNGHFYDTQTKQRVGLKDGSTVCITCPTEYFISFLPIGSHLEILSPADKLSKMQADEPTATFKKIYDRGQILYFEISRNIDNRTIMHEFAIEPYDISGICSTENKSKPQSENVPWINKGPKKLT